MKYKAPPIEIPPENPFNQDLLGRKASADILTQFVGSLTESFVLAIDSPWGTGKTTFLKMWVQMLRNSEFRCLYFSAWENDFSDSPLVSLIGEIGSSLDHLGEKAAQTKLTQNYKKVKDLGAALVKTATPAILKIMTSGIVDLKGVGEELGNLAEDVAKKKIEKYEADKSTIHDFRKHLTKLIAKQAESGVATPCKPVVFIIDELDRCRPDYAIELLEKVKHLFNVEGLVFILAIDKDQLGQSIKALYGAGLDADGYLKRFIDLEYRLPKADTNAFMRSQFERFGLDKLFAKRSGALASDRENLEDAVVELFKLFNFSLRQQEQCCTQIAIAVRTTPPNHYLLGTFLGTLICLRAQNRELYMRYVEGHARPKDVLDFIRGFPAGDKLVESNLGAIIEAHLVVGIRDQSARNTAANSYHKTANSEMPDGAIRSRTQAVSEYIRFLSRGSLFDLTDYLFKKIEFAHQFVNLGDDGN